MAKTSKGVILSQASQIKSDYSFALIKATADNKSLVQDASSAELKVNALVEYSKDSQWDPKKLTNLGFPAGCFLIVDLRGQDIHAADLITNLALVRQYGYQAGVIDDLSTLDDIKALKANQIYLINSGKTNDDQDASLNGNEITDGSGKLAVGMSVKWQRDYTNVDVSGDHAGFVGMGQDTLLKGGNAFGYSTNGRDFNAVITPKGLIFRRPDAERMWRLLKPNEIADINSTVGDKVKKEVDSATAEIPAAVSAANSAVSAAESAVAASKVNSDAIVAQSEAISEAKSAMDSATAEIQQTAANAASDAAKIRADVARVQNEVDTAKAANSASVEALKSDINTAKQDLADVHDSLDKAQAAAEQNQKAINDSITEINANVDATNQDLAGVRKDLTKVQSDITANQKAVNDNVAQINSNIEQDRKDIASAQQANADTAKQLDTYSKQAATQGKTIKSIQDKQDSFTATLADVQGNVSQVSDKVDGLSASLKDTQGNVATVKAQADQLSATLTDHAKSIATLTASAKELSSTLEDADGRLSKVEQTAQTNSSTLSDVQGNLSQVKQQADGLVSTLKDAQGNISTLQQKADSLSTQLASAQGDIATLQTGIGGVKAILTSHDKSIHTLQADSKSLKDSMVNAQGDISTLRKTATDVTSELEDHTGRLSKVEQSAAKQAITLSDLQGNLSQVEQKADSNTATISSINKNAMQDRGVITDTKTSFDSLTQLGTYSIKASGLSMMPEQHYGTLVVSGSAGSGWLSQQFVADTTGNVYTRVFSNNSWSAWKQGGSQDAINQVKQTADSNSATIRNVQGDVNTLKQTATGVEAALADHDKNIHTLQADAKSLTDDITDAQGNISKLQKTSTDLTSEIQDHNGRLSKVEQTANTLTNEFSDQQGHLNRVEQTANGTQQTVANQQGQINSIKTDAASIHETLTGQGNQIANINVTLSGLNTKYEGVSGDLNNLKSQAQWATVTSAVDLNNVKTPCHEFLKGTVTNAPNEVAWWYLTVEGSESGRITQTVIADQSNNRYTRRWADSWSAWVRDATQTDVTALSNRITTNSTQITQNKQAIALKADQSTVDNLSGEVSQNSAQLKVQAGQISSKVSSTDFKTLNDKVANMKIGGRNLLHNTSDQYKTLTGSGWLYVTSASDMWTSTADYSRGQQFIYSAKITNFSTVPVRLALYCYGANKTGQLHKTTGMTVSGGTSARCSVSITMDANTWFLCSDVETLDGQAPQFSIQVKDEKLEEGNVATPWTPNPDDLITSISKNSTAIDQTNQQISLKADQTEVNKIKDIASHNSSRLDVMAGQISSKVTSTDVNNIVDSKGYATTSTVQSLITQKAGTISESITNLDQTVKQGAENNVQLVRKSEFEDGSKGSWDAQMIASATNPAPPAELGQSGMKVLQSNTRDAFEDGIWYSVKPGEKFDVDFWCAPSPAYASSLGLEFVDKDKKNPSWQGVSTKLHGPWEHITGTITAPANASFAMPWFNMDKPADNTGNSAWLAKPSIRRQNATTVAAIQQITASIDGLQSTVANKADKSQITQLSNVIQSKVSASDFNDLKDKTTWKSADSIDLNNAVSQQKIFVKGGSNLPPGDYWWYVQVESGYDNRIVQYAVSDRDNIHYSRQYDGSKWSAWSQGATESEITQLRDDINLRVKSGDLLSQINLTAGNTLIQSNKLYLDASSVVITGTAFIPSAAIASLSADKVNTGWLNTNNVSLGDGRTRIRADHDYMYIQPTGSAASNTGIRMGYSGLDFLTNVIPNGYSSSVPYYSVGYDGAANGYFKISAFDHINPGGATATQNWYTMVDAISLTNSEINFGAHGNMHMQVVDGGVNVRPTLLLQNNTNNGTWAGFTRLDNSDTVEFNTGNNNGENFHVNSGARFMQYVYINGYARAQGWLTNSALSKKMNIRKLDLQTALDKIRQDDQYLYEYKRNVAQGIHDPQASFIIDDVHDVAHYSVPREFIDNTGKYREPSVELAYLIAAFQAIDKQVQAQQAEIKILKEQLQHE